MNRIKSFILVVITVCILALVAITLSGTLLVQADFGSGIGDTTGATQPNPSVPGEARNTLLAVGASSGGVLINEVMFYPPSGGHEWVELKNAGTAAVDISAWQVSDEDGNIYTIPDALPGVPPGNLVLIYFDGAGTGSDDYDFSDNFASLHTQAGLVDIFDNSADQCTLRGTLALNGSAYLPPVEKQGTSSADSSPSGLDPQAVVPPEPGPSSDPSPSTLLGFVAWGADPGAAGDEAAAIGMWGEGMYVSTEAGAGVIDPAATFPQGGTIGLGPGSTSAIFHNWTNFRPAHVSPGTNNPTRSVSWIHPASGATIDSSTFSVSWASMTGATGYWFEMDDSADFSSPQIELTLPFTRTAFTPDIPIAEGTYYWRVKAVSPSGESQWTPGAEINVASFDSGIPIQNLTEKSLGIEWQLQHKDTIMLCLDGCNESGECAWDQEHITRGIHGDMYCSRASASMLASYYGGALSQDRLTYHIFGGGDPGGDLGHNIGASVTEIGDMLEWALGTTITGSEGIPTFDQVKDWIDEDRPVYSVVFWPSGAVMPGSSTAIGLSAIRSAWR